MPNDPLFFDFFKEIPSCFFELVDRPATDADLYEMDSLELKASSVRLDGVFRPKRPGAGPAYLWEAQFYRDESFYANMLTKVGLFLKKRDPAQEWIVVVIYPSRLAEQKTLSPYRCLLKSDQFIPIYLDELPPAKPDQLELGVLELIAAKPEVAAEKARTLLPKVRTSKRPDKIRRSMLEFIKTVVAYQFPKLSRAEINNMLQVTDFRQTRIYQEGHEEGREEEREAVARKMLQKEKPITEIAEFTGLTPAQVRKLAKKPRK